MYNYSFKSILCGFCLIVLKLLILKKLLFCFLFINGRVSWDRGFNGGETSLG